MMDPEYFENATDQQPHEKPELDDGFQKEQKLDAPTEQLERYTQVISLVSTLVGKVAQNKDSDVQKNLEVISLVTSLLEEIAEKNKANDKAKYDKIKERDTISASQKLAASSSDRKIEKQKKLTTKPISNRLEYLSRPKKDILDSIVNVRLDGSLPEDAYPSWHLMPLPTKIPFADCPIAITKRKLGTNLFLPPPGKDFDLADENNMRLPSISYENMHDPNLKEFFENKDISEHLKKEGFITESGKTTCSLSDINRYRVYQRRVLAAEAQEILRDQDKEFRKVRARGMEEKIKEDMQRYYEMRTQGTMRRWIKDTISSIKDSSMENQRRRDKQVLNSTIGRQKAQKVRLQGVEERRQKIFDRHMRKKYSEDEIRKREDHLAYAEEDFKRLEQLCKIQETAKLQRIEKLNEFWKRKSDWQKEWIEKGKELERRMEDEKARNIETLKRTGKLPLMFGQKENEDIIEKLEQKYNDKVLRPEFDINEEATKLDDTKKEEKKSDLSLRTLEEDENGELKAADFSEKRTDHS